MMSRHLHTPSLPVLFSTLVWGVIEVLALFRSRSSQPRNARLD
jgi:hypothetical protein